MPSFIQNQRRQPRLALRLPVEILHRGESWEAETADVGPGGCLVVSARHLAERSRVGLVLRCQPVGDALRVPGSVAWSREALGGVAFTSRQPAPGADPDDWFKRVLDVHPVLAGRLGRVPERLALDAPLYLLPPPRLPPDLGPDEMELLALARNGARVHALLSSASMPDERAVRALFALFERGVLTLAMGQAGEEWRWRTVLAGAGDPPRPRRQEPSAPGPGVTPPGRSAPALERSDGPAPPVAGEPFRLLPATANGFTPRQALLRGASAAHRSPEAQLRLDQARAAAGAARIDQAVALLRQALALAPRDAEISRLLGQLAFKDRKI